MKEVDLTGGVGEYFKRMRLVGGRTTAEEEIDLGRRVMEGEAAEKEMAAQELAQRNWALVVPMAARYVKWGVNLMDLIQSGNVGLVEASRSYDPRRGVRFGTYATWLIRREVQEGVIAMAREIRLPEDILKQVFVLLRKEEKLTQVLGQEPSEAQLAEEMRIPAEKVRKLRGWSKRMVRGSGAENRLERARAEEETVLEQVMERLRRAAAEEVLAGLAPEEGRVLRRLFWEDWNLEQVGEELGGVSRQRVGQIKERILSKTRRTLRGARRWKAVGELLEED